jgi:hypothetical protein
MAAPADSPAAAAPPSPRLDYSPAPPRCRRRLRRAGLVVAVVAIAVAGWRWGPAVRDRATLLYWQRRCATYAPPPDQVVYATGAADAAALGRDRAYAAWPSGPPNGPPVTYRLPPDCVGRYPPAASTASTAAGAGTPPGPVLFLHERRTPAGERRVVVVRLYPSSWVPVLSHTIRPAGLRAAPAVDPRPGLSTGFFFAADPARHRLRILAGQPDPADASRFTIDYDVDGKPGTVRGQLVDTPNGPAVRLTLPPPADEPVILE